MYGLPPFSTPSGQQSPGPPQPEWRLPSTAQQQPPPPPRPPLNPSVYNPNSPPVSSIETNSSPATAVDTSSWGVRYNRQHHIQTPPPLPPRPSSTPGKAPNPQSPIWSSSDANKPLPAAPQLPTAEQYQQALPANAPYTRPHLGGSLPGPPPPPPPLPPAYQSVVSQPNSKPSQQPSTSLYTTSFGQHRDSSSQQHNVYSPAERPLPQVPPSEHVPVSTGNMETYGSVPMTAPPIPPKASASIAPTSSSLGTFTPSDWEHLSPPPGDVYDERVFESKQDTTASSTTASEYQPSYAATVPHIYAQSAISTPFSNVSPTIQSVHAQDTTAMQDQFKVSPISPGTNQGISEPPPPAGVKTNESIFCSASATETSEIIDGVIEAWNRPVSAEPTPSNIQSDTHFNPGNVPSSPLPKLSPLEIPRSKKDVAIPRKEVPTQSSGTSHEKDMKSQPSSPQVKLLDPYEDLDPWSKSSLERYVAMLRKEAVADTDAERFNIFTAFVAKETKLREILYNIGHEEKDADQQPTTGPQLSGQVSGQGPPSVESGLIPIESQEDCDVLDDIAEDFVDGRYSPGGRPILPRLHTPSLAGIKRSVSNPAGPKYGPERLVQGHFSRSTSVPPSTNDSIHKHCLSPLTTHPPQPIYTPFRYTEGPQRGSDHLVFDLPAYQAYSALRQASAESGRVMSNAPPVSSQEKDSPTASSTLPNQHDETFIGLIREKSVAYRTKTTRKTSSPPPLPISLRQGRPAHAVDELRSMVSSPLAKRSESSWHKTTREELEKHPDDFGYIEETVKSWEMANKPRKEGLDKERIRRQEESEKHIDALFNGKEIGYADINVLEEEFRQAEARVQLDEERRELDDFVANVFDPLEKRLDDELCALRTHYDSALGQLDHENSQIKDSVTDKYNLSHTMKVVNEVYQKLELRYQKRFEIALDLERRRKKAERRPLVFMGDSPALKRLDGDFDQMERRNILEAAKDRDDRANRLMDSFDDAIMHGLGENQSLLDEVSTKLSRIDAIAIRSSGLVDSEIEQMLKSVYKLVESLREDSESILHSFGIADSTLNDADYHVSVAEARYSNADADIFCQLDNEKAKEDAKIQSDLRSKLESVRAGPANITATINELLKSLDKASVVEQPASPETAPPSHPAESLLPGPPPSTIEPRKSKDVAHQERLRKALEDAKKRNAARHNNNP